MKIFPGIWLMTLGIIGSFPNRSVGEDWPSFRGEGASGLSSIEGPLTWDLDTRENLLWKSPIRGLGLSSPVIEDGKVYLTTAVAEAGDAELKVGLYGNIASADDDSVHSYRVLCLDARTGEILWNREVNKTRPAIKRHTKASHANCTVATDGRHVVAFFGSEGLYCLDPDGNLIWERTFGTLDSGYFMVPSAQWGFASSPFVHEGRIILQCDVQEGSFVAAFDITNGKEVWKTPRDEVPTWGTPCVIEHEGMTQVILNGFRHIGGYDFDTGREIWKLEGGGDIPVPTPIYSNGLILITNAHGAMAPIYAIRPDATGQLTAGATDASTSDSISWWHRRGGNYMQTPIVIGKHAFFCADMG
ncbi:MAG: PQQ-binding-like beta-propeller repeat protein [Verrucomicrobiota bacterium]